MSFKEQGRLSTSAQRGSTELEKRDSTEQIFLNLN